MNLRSPLGQVLGSGSAKAGTEHWWSQLVTAVALLLLGSWFLYSIMRLDGYAHATMLEWIAQPFNGVMLLSLSLTLAWHSALGVQVVLEDYVHGPFIKVASLLFSRFAHALLAITAVVSILKVVLGDSV